MDISSTGPTQGARVASAVFEPAEEGFTYFPFVWSRGYPVTAAERQKYIENFTPSYASDFRAHVCSRPPVRPPRLDGFWKNLDALSPRANGALATLFIPTVISAIEAQSLGWKFLLIAGAVIEALAVLKLVLRRFKGANSDSATPPA